jgi:hypothetical protein
MVCDKPSSMESSVRFSAGLGNDLYGDAIVGEDDLGTLRTSDDGIINTDPIGEGIDFHRILMNLWLLHYWWCAGARNSQDHASVGLTSDPPHDATTRREEKRPGEETTK